jgi:dynein light chain LC8-type
VQNVQEGDQQGEGVEEQQFDPNQLRVSVKSTDMSENMVLFVIEKTILAFEAAEYSLETQKEGSKLDYNTLISKFIKGEMELFYKPTWHVIVGDNYGGFFTHEEFNSVVFCMNDKWITVFKSNVPQKD